MNETPASLLLRDAEINLQISDALATHLPEAPFQHEIYFQAFYAVEKAVKAVCDICGIATLSPDTWNPKIKTHDISTLLQSLEATEQVDGQMAKKITLAMSEIPFRLENRYPNLVDKKIPHEIEFFTTESANKARLYARKFVYEVKDWVAAHS